MFLGFFTDHAVDTHRTETRLKWDILGPYLCRPAVPLKGLREHPAVCVAALEQGPSRFLSGSGLRSPSFSRCLETCGDSEPYPETIIKKDMLVGEVG